MKITQFKRPRIQPYAFKVKCRSNWAVINNFELLRIIEWIILNIGLVDSAKWEVRFPSPHQINIYFKQECDAVAFKLRWL